MGRPLPPVRRPWHARPWPRGVPIDEEADLVVAVLRYHNALQRNRECQLVRLAWVQLPLELKPGRDPADPFRLLVRVVRERMLRTLVAIVGFDNHAESQAKPSRIGRRCPVVNSTTEHKQKAVGGSRPPRRATRPKLHGRASYVRSD